MGVLISIYAKNRCSGRLSFGKGRDGFQTASRWAAGVSVLFQPFLYQTNRRLPLVRPSERFRRPLLQTMALWLPAVADYRAVHPAAPLCAAILVVYQNTSHTYTISVIILDLNVINRGAVRAVMPLSVLIHIQQVLVVRHIRPIQCRAIQ